MTQAEQALLIAYLVDAGELDPEGDLEEQFLDWRQVRWETVSGETHYQGVPRASSMPPESRRGVSRKDAGLAWPRARRSWAGTNWQPPLVFTASWTMSTGRRTEIRDPAQKSTWWPLTGADRRVLCPEDHQGGPFAGKQPGFGHSGRRELPPLECSHEHRNRPHPSYLPRRPRAPGRRAGDARPGQDPERRREGLGGDEAGDRGTDSCPLP